MTEKTTPATPVSVGPKRRHVLALAMAPVLGGATRALAAEPTVVRYVSAFPVLSLVVANQTSLPRHLGYYEEEGVKVEFALSAAGGTTGAVQLVASGDQDIGSGSMSPVLSRAALGQDMGIVFFYNQLREFNTHVGVNPASGIKTMAELKGKLVGVPTLAGEGTLVARYIAREAGLDADKDLRFIAVGVGAQALHALKTNQVAALVMTSGNFAQMETLGFTFTNLPLPPSARGLFGPGLFARRDFIQKNRKAVIGVARAVAKSTLFLITNPEAAIRIHWKLYPEQVPQGIPPEQALRDALHVLKAQAEGLNFAEGDKTRQWGTYTPQSWVKFVDYLNLSDKLKDPSPYFTNELAAEVNAFDRQKVISQAQNFRMA